METNIWVLSRVSIPVVQTFREVTDRFNLSVSRLIQATKLSTILTTLAAGNLRTEFGVLWEADLAAKRCPAPNSVGGVKLDKTFTNTRMNDLSTESSIMVVHFFLSAIC